jgi:hypothetical protein
MVRRGRAARQDLVSMPIPQAMLKRLARLVVAVFYRRVDIVDAGNLPAGGPAILALNHTNGLADSVVVIATTAGFPNFLAAASWWKFAPARWLFELAGVLPVHQRREGENTRQNDSSFEACHEALAQGARIAIQSRSRRRRRVRWPPDPRCGSLVCRRHNPGGVGGGDRATGSPQDRDVRRAGALVGGSPEGRGVATREWCIATTYGIPDLVVTRLAGSRTGVPCSTAHESSYVVTDRPVSRVPMGCIHRRSWDRNRMQG